jgi:plastocyanin
MLPRSHSLALVLVIGALSLSACATAAQAEAVRTLAVSLPPSYQFEPAAIQVQAGDTVTWTNSDHFSHNIHVMSPVEWRSDIIAPGEGVSYTFADPGEYAYQCDLHPQDMTGTVTVLAP